MAIVVTDGVFLTQSIYYYIGSIYMEHNYLSRYTVKSLSSHDHHTMTATVTKRDLYTI